ncbi:MAG: hypothetical protein MJE77_40585 [Proteobacteria bacterium]|nr:hypothetical protein [Pseudomonadota bacterium]
MPVRAGRKWRVLTVEELSSSAALSCIVREMRSESCAHIWRNLASTDTAERAAVELLEWEQQKRPTTLFAYYGNRADGGRDLWGAATVSDRVSKDFIHDGFPVLARAYVRRQYRNLGLYRMMLEHRYRYCQRRWGRALRAIHLGSASPAVVAAATAESAISSHFQRICVEALRVQGKSMTVNAFLSFQPCYLDSIRAAFDRAKSLYLCPQLAALHVATEELLACKNGMDIFTLRELYLRAKDDGAWIEELSVLEGVLAFCDFLTPEVKHG